MTDEFLTEGLRDDRYLKAVRLMNQFEDEIEARLLQLDQRLVDAQPGLFESDVEPDTRTNRSPGNGLTLHRVNHSMTGPQVSGDGKTQKLNVHLYWMPPTEYNRTDVDGALRDSGIR